MIRMSSELLDKFNDIEKKHWWWEGRRELLRYFFKRRKPKYILDIGCGTGETLSFLRGYYPKTKLYGVDTSSRAISYSKVRGHKNIKNASATNLPFKNNFFDTVLFLDVLEHIKDDNKAIGEARRVLKKGGIIIITAPALSFIWSEHDIKQGHKKRYTRREIRKLAIDNQLEMSFISYFNFIFSLPIIIIRLLSRLMVFRSFANYDKEINYNIAKVTAINSILKYLFVLEIKALRFIKYPIGISVSAVLKKQ
jgi:ubiquinone/menaquinone biosynthesis C-methylase UbiE